MTGRNVQSVLDESAAVTCHHIWFLAIGHLLIAAEVFDDSGSPNL